LIEFCTGGCDKRTSARKAEGYPLIETVNKERFVKTWKAGKNLVDAVVICKECESTIAL
jgi:hypothetical protein